MRSKKPRALRLPLALPNPPTQLAIAMPPFDVLLKKLWTEDRESFSSSVFDRVKRGSVDEGASQFVRRVLEGHANDPVVMDDLVESLNRWAAVGIATAHEEEERGWAEPGESDARANLVLTWELMNAWPWGP